ncbi:MAG: SDR family oxidoreductase [Elusimicrobia bacterium]|nr:SDR family oxidoreductase [Elusimicrobiota bacterium]
MKKKRFSDKVTVITGGCRGIGKNIARAFGREEATVIICDIDKRNGKSAKDELCKLGITAEFLYADLARKGAARGMIQQVVEKWGRIDILINNARSGAKKTSFLEETEDSWEQGISVTLKAAFFAAQEAIRSMSKTGGGNIVNIASIGALLVCHESAVYHIAKAGMVQMTHYLAVKAGGYGIRVNAVLPGFIVQDEHQSRYRNADNLYYREVAEFCHPVRHVGKSDDISNAVLFLCMPDTDFISGHCLVVDGGATLQEQSTLLYGFNVKKK